jgi:hypothetical protein
VYNQWLCINQCKQHVKGYIRKPCLGCPNNTTIAVSAGCCIDLWFCLFMLPVVVVVVVVVVVMLLLVVVVVVVVY